MGVAGRRELLYVSGPVLPGLVDTGGGMLILFIDVLPSPLATDFAADSIGAWTGPPFNEEIEFLSQDEVFATPFGSS